MSLARRLPAAFLLPALLLAVTVLSGSAAAAPVDPRHGSVVSRSTALDWCPANAAICQDNKKIVQLDPGTRVQMECWIDSRAQPGTGPRWFYVTGAGSPKREGFVKAESISEDSQWINSPPCTANKGIMASLWTTGLDHWQKKTPTSADKQIARTRAVGGPSDFPQAGDWSGECIGFVVLAYQSVGIKVPWMHARQTAATYGKKLRRDVSPPRGALVFWDFYQGGYNYGHVAMSVGNGMAVGTKGTDGDNLPIDMYSVSSRAGYLGWVYA